MKRIVLVTWYDPANFPPIMNTASVLARAGHEVVCLCVYRDGGSSVAPGERITYAYQNDPPGGYAKTFLSRIREASGFRHYVQKQIARLDPDLVIAYDHWGLWGAAEIVPQRPIVYYVLDILERRRTSWYSREHVVSMIAKAAATRCQLLVVPDRGRLDYLKAQTTITIPTAVVGNTPLLSEQHGRQTELKELIEKRSGSYPTWLIVIVGNMGLYAETIEALTRLDPRWHLAVIGCGSAAAREQMERDVAARGLEKRCHFFGYTPYETVRRWLRSCDVGLALYPDLGVNWRLVGTSSVKAMEYMAAAIPTLVLPGNGFDELVRTGGVLEIAGPSAGEIADAIGALEPGGSEWTRVGRAAYEAHRSEYHLERQMEPILNLLR